MADTIITQFVEVTNFDNWTNERKESVDTNGQIAFVPENAADTTSVSHLYAKGKVFGDGAVSNKTVLTNDITIAGGPLANDAVKNAFADGKIPAGTDLQELLTTLLCQEIWPESIVTTNANVVLNAPQPTVSASSYVEVGTALSNVFTVKYKAASYSVTDAKLNGFTYGYYQNGTYNEAKSIESETTYSGTPSASVSVSVTNTTDDAAASCNEPITNVTADQQLTSIPSTVYANVGNVTATVVRTTAANDTVYNCDAIGETYKASNLKNNGQEVDGQNTVYSIDAKTSVAVASPNDSTVTKTVVGTYPIKFNGVQYSDSSENGSAISSTTVTGTDELINKGAAFAGSKTMYVKFPKQDVNSWKIAIPQYYTNATVEGYAFDSLMSKKYDAAIGTFTKTATTVTLTCGDNSTEYVCDIWESTGTSGANGVKLIINLQ